MENKEVIVRQYGLRPPLDWDDDAHEVLWLQNRLWNTLVEIDHEHNAQYRALIDGDPDVAPIRAPGDLERRPHGGQPRHYTRRLNQLRHRQKTLSRRVKGSNRYHDARRRVARVHRRIRASRSDALHKLTTHLIRENQAVMLEDLHVRGLVRHPRLARAMTDTGFGELRRQLAYKAEWHGRHLIVVDRWFPSSKRCSCCQHTLDELALSVRRWTCPQCERVHDRDTNAATNILAEGLKQLEPAGGRGSRVEKPSAGVLPRAARETGFDEARIVHNTAQPDG
jgi:putative transposase